jgi:hypothetical protein
MKKLFFLTLLGAIGLLPFRSAAQVSVNINIGSQPSWGPVGYDHVDYYYMPDIDSYYNVPKKQFVYLNNNNWVFSNSLPSRYSGYDLYNGYKVVINSPTPYRYYKDHKVKYAKYKSNHSQLVIRNSKDVKYKAAKGNSGNGKGKGNGGGHGNGKGNH